MLFVFVFLSADRLVGTKQAPFPYKFCCAVYFQCVDQVCCSKCYQITGKDYYVYTLYNVIYGCALLDVIYVHDNQGNRHADPGNMVTKWRYVQTSW